jgi:ribose transport system substrate-binding protein
VALVMKSLANEFFATMAEGAKGHQASSGDRYELIVNGMRNETDVSEQVTIIEQMVARKVAAIVIAPADSQAVVPALKRAADAGVLVVNIDNRLDPEICKATGLVAPFVGPDNRAGARKAGEAVARLLSAGDEVAIIEGIPTADNARQRALGLEDAVAAAGLVIVGRQSGQWEMEKANGITAALLSEHPSLKAILCANDSMALGAAAAVAAAFTRPPPRLLRARGGGCGARRAARRARHALHRRGGARARRAARRPALPLARPRAGARRGGG